MTDYEKVLEFATKAHKGVKRKGSGLPYITHPVEVAKIAFSLHERISKNHNLFATYRLEPSQWDIQLVALLHDVVEDTEYTIEDIRSEFGNIIHYESLEVLTHDPRDDYFIYMMKIIKGPAEAKIVKLADITHNLRSAEGNVSKHKINVYKLSKYMLQQELGL